MASAALLPIGQLAKATGTSVSALRYYEEVGVVAPATRVGGQRRFDQSAVGRVSFVRRAQEAGFSLVEIRTILDDTSGGWHELVEAKLIELRERRDRLDTMIEMLGAVRDCGCTVVATCPRLGSC